MYEPSKPPPYASMVMVEVFRDQITRNIEVRFLFRNRTAPIIPENDSIEPVDRAANVDDDDDTKPYVKYLLG